jgi:exonuclease I
MTDLQLTFDWADDSDYGIAAHDATFADFAMHVGDTCVTAFVATDSDDETVRTFLYRPLYPVAEWLACNC